MGIFGGGFSGSKCSTHLKLCLGRIKLLRNKREVALRGTIREVAALLQVCFHTGSVHWLAYESSRWLLGACRDPPWQKWACLLAHARNCWLPVEIRGEGAVNGPVHQMFGYLAAPFWARHFSVTLWVGAGRKTKPFSRKMHSRVVYLRALL